MSDAPSGKLKEQDLSNLDVTKLTPSSPEVISRQATINIGTIGHVAHGKSTIVKAVSGVQTVRFKNELERNITIKLDSKVDERQQSTSSDTIPVTTKLNEPVKRKHSSGSDFNSSKIKVVRCFDERSLENVNAALCDAEKCIEKSSNQSQDIPVKNDKISEKEANSSGEDSEISDNQNNIVQKNVQEHNDKNSDNSLLSLALSPNVTNSSNKVNNNNSNIDSPLDDGSETEECEIKDTAIIIIPTLLDVKVDIGYRYIVANDHIKKFILSGQVMEQEDTADAYEPTEIDQIIDDEIVNGIHYYLVKWKNWSKGFNTWERFGALTKVQQMLFDYAVKKKRGPIKEINAIHLMLSRKTISELFQLFKTESGLSLPLISYDDLNGLVTSVEIDAEKCRALRTKSLRYCLNIIALGNYRAQQLYNLKQWELDISVVTGHKNITVENNTDFEGPPDSFAYTTKYIARCGIIISDDPPIGCSCKKNCTAPIECCYKMWGYSSVYDMKKKITIAPGVPVYECNKKCKCSAACPNRVVQLGSSVSVCIYKTNKYGWGVKANHDIEKGQFVANYVGEIITEQESENRLLNNSSRLDCMWNLDFDDAQNFKYTIDGTHYANFTYFINHSCNANLSVYAVWIDCLDPNISQLALFANRDIVAGEQLTTNYFARCSKDVLKKSGIKCQCQMKNCKGYYF